MDKPRITVLFGTRPDVIKLASLIKILKKDPAFDCITINSGQHDLKVVNEILRFFGLGPPDVNLCEMTANQTPNDVLSKVVKNFKRTPQPDMIVVQGDTTSALAGALYGFNVGIPIAHVEAGIRTGNIYNPWPEEANRIFIDRIGTLLFPPTGENLEKLEDEKIKCPPENITGNTSIDALMWCCQKIIESGFMVPVYGYNTRHVFVTVHRRASFGEPLEQICNAIANISKRHPEFDFIWPVHPNPNVSNVIHSMRYRFQENVCLVSPYDYMSSISMIATSHMVITDSGGVQEEAASFAVPTIVLRERTDRMEHEAWANSHNIEKALCYMHEYKNKIKISGTDREKIEEDFEFVLRHANKRAEEEMDPSKIFTSIRPLYGDGKASERIAAHLRQYFGMTPELFPDPEVFQ